MHFYSRISPTEELCYNVEVDGAFSRRQIKKLKSFFREKGTEHIFSASRLRGDVAEVGPHPQMRTNFCSQAIELLHDCGLFKIKIVEVSRRIVVPAGVDRDSFVADLYDPMRERIYYEPLQSFVSNIVPPPVITVPLLGEGMEAMARANKEYKLGFDSQFQEHFFNLFVNYLKRNPTNAELIQLAAMCSNHSFHTLFGAVVSIDGQRMAHTLMELIKEPWRRNPGNSVVAFHDNASAIRGAMARILQPENPGQPSRMIFQEALWHISTTVETHCYPTLWCPWPGAQTGIGGCLRDGLAIGRGGDHRHAIAGFYTGNLFIDDYPMPWEIGAPMFPSRVMASPLRIIKDATWGTWAYGNQYGVPVTQGVARTFGMIFPSGEHYEYYKPIMMAGLHGGVRDEHAAKGKASKGLTIVGIGGPGYRIGYFGGPGSSEITDEAKEVSDRNAVQRGDSLMGQVTWRVIRACTELGSRNPIISIHDQGAVGPCGVLTELIEKSGGRISIRKIHLGDSTLSFVEIWVCEYQERYGLLIHPDDLDLFISICDYEGCPVEILGEVTGDGNIVVYDELDGSTPIDFPIEAARAGLPQKVITDKAPAYLGGPITIPGNLTLSEALDWVMKFPHVGSKDWLVDRVDTTVGGLVVQNQRCGPHRLPLSNVAVSALDFLGKIGSVTALGECPPKMMLNPRAGARMAVAEMLTNLAAARITKREDIRASVNWMWPAKGIPGGVAKLYYAMEALTEFMMALGIACDGGKDSTSLAALIAKMLIKSPETLVITGYAMVPDFREVATPNIKSPGQSRLLYIDFGGGKYRLGGSAFLQYLKQLGEECPDIEDRDLFVRAWEAIQRLHDMGKLLSLHDRSCGGLLITILEMLFAGDCGASVSLKGADIWGKMFAEEAGFVLEIHEDDLPDVLALFEKCDVPVVEIGRTKVEKTVKVAFNNEIVLAGSVPELRSAHRETSHQIDRLQINPVCADQAKQNLLDPGIPSLELTFTPRPTPREILEGGLKPRVAVLRNKGTNGDREMIAAFKAVGFEVYDVHMKALITGQITLDFFQGIVFAGGFSFADIFGAGKGWAMQVRECLAGQLKKFMARPNTWILGVCNGCQAGALLGLAPFEKLDRKRQPLFLRNTSRAFESRSVEVGILKSPSIMFTDMAGSRLTIPVAHGEGRMWFPDEGAIREVAENYLATMAFVDNSGSPTMDYPLNPNGSVYGWTGLCDPTGRFNLMMPHPERIFLLQQWPWLPQGWDDLLASPWIRLFQNFYAFSVAHCD